ncbi:MAG: FAD-binding oxidoreductase, partial [Planctomyces sp.]
MTTQTHTTHSACSMTPQFLQRLRDIVGSQRVLDAPDELVVYECDGYVIEKNAPDVVLFPQTADEVQRIVRECLRFRIPFVARGAGTSLAGGSLPVGGGVMIALTKMNRILEINLRDRYAVVEPGCVNVRLTRALAGTGFHYAPDPSSQGACTIGGNVATNSGGPHTLKYGVTVNHVLGIEFVSPEGELVQFGGPCGRGDALDLTGVFVGSEGTFGVVTKVWVRITRDPAATRTMLASEDILNRCIELGGSVTGEHGIGVEKISFMSKLFTATDLEVMNDVR